MMIFTQIAGWVGTALIVSAYFLISNKKIEGTSRVFQAMNLFGAIGVGRGIEHEPNLL